MKEKVVLAYSGGLDTTALIPWLKETFNYDVVCSALTADRETNWTDWTREPNFPELPNYILKILLMNSATNILCHV